MFGLKKKPQNNKKQKKTVPENFAFLILKILELLPVKFKFF